MAGSSYSYTGHVVDITITQTGVYDITAYGAQGGAGRSGSGGDGAEASGEFTLTAGENLVVVVGGQGGASVGGGGGGGGSFVLEATGGGGYTPLVIAAGGGGTGISTNSGGGTGQTTTSGQSGQGGLYAGAGGSGGQGGQGGQYASGYNGGGGGGLNSAGSAGLYYRSGGGGSGPSSFAGGSAGFGLGGGGFGGGGGNGYSGGGGGGGYSGGGGGAYGGGGGGSFDGGTNQVLVAGEHSGNGLVTLDFIAVCYLRGTRILTDRGEVAVEKLAIGDFVVTASREMKPIRWIGWREISCAAHPEPEKVWPVRIAAGALGAETPRRDLRVSPEHCLFLGGALVPARLLVNETTIVQEPVARVSYWHVELDRHDLIIAEGAAAESYLDCNNRIAFANGGAAIALHADFSGGAWREAAFWAEHGCAPRVVEGPALRSVQRSLAARAADMGLPARATADAGVVVLADGEILTPVSVAQNCFRFEAPAGVEALRLRSRSAVPARLAELDSADARRLGVLLARLEIDGRDIALDDAALCDGWHAVERQGQRQWRWSNGDAALPPGGSLTLWLYPLPAAYPLPTRKPEAMSGQPINRASRVSGAVMIAPSSARAS